MTSRLAFARQVKERSLESPEARAVWERARAGVRASPRYAGLDLQPLEGLLPLGADPDSGLWEFCHVQSGERPERDADGRLVLREDMGLVLVLIPGGEFLMGSPEGEGREDERPQHEVELQPFLLSKYELTQGQWLRVTGQTPSWFKAGTKAVSHSLLAEFTLLNPVENVSWNDAQEVLPHLGLRLPSEAQWEYACRAGTTTTYSFGDDPYKLRDYGWNDEQTTHPIGWLKPNAFGLHDMHGNVYEWVQDAWHDNYRGAPTDGTAWDQASSSKRVNRGGCWALWGGQCRAADRNWNEPGMRNYDLGFRLSRSYP